MNVVYAINAAAGQWAWYVWHVTWQASLVAALVVLIAWAGRRRSVRLAYGLLVLALVKFAILPTFSFSTGLFSRMAPAVEVPARAQGSSWLMWLMIVHVVGAAVVAGWVALQLIHLARLTRRARPVTSGPVYRHLSYMARKMGLHRSVRLFACDEGTSPMACGVLAPSVIVPEAMLTDLPPRQVATVLAHELAHHRRGDLWINWLQIILAIVWWFNPLVWLLNRAVRKMREDCCDDLLLREQLATDDGYCETLLLVAAQMSRARLLGGLPRFAERLHPLGRRIIRIMDPDVHCRSVLSRARTPALALLALLVLPGLQVHSFLMPPPPGRANRPALTASGLRGSATIMAPSPRSMPRRYQRRVASASTAPLMLTGLRRPTSGRQLRSQAAFLPGTVAAARPAMRSARWSMSVVEVVTARGTLAVGIDRSTLPRAVEVASAQPAALGMWPTVRSRTGPISIVQRAVDLVDSVADSRDDPVAPTIAAEPGPPPIIGDEAPAPGGATGGLARIVEPELIISPAPTPALAAMPVLDIVSPLAGQPVISVQIDPLEVLAWTDDTGSGGGSVVDDGGFTPSPRTPEPATFALMALGGAAVLRRRRR